MFEVSLFFILFYYFHETENKLYFPLSCVHLTPDVTLPTKHWSL